jgi:ribosomal protein L35AE/L33A
MAAPFSLAVRFAPVTFLLAVSLARTAAAQPVTESFEQLPAVIKKGTVVYVQDEQGQRTKGKIRELSPASLTLFTSDGHRQERSFPADRVARISRVDSRLNGFLIGAAAGAAPGVWLGVGWKTYCSNESADCPLAPLYFGAAFGLIGGWIGFEIDDAINGQKLVFRRAGPSPAARIHFTPVLTGRLTGARVSITF